MIVDERLSPEKLAELEQEIKNGNLELLREYVSDAITFHLDSKSELQRRKKLSQVNNKMGQVNAIHWTAILAATTQDRVLWDRCIRVLGARTMPHLGYISYSYLEKQTNDSKILTDWSDLLEFSAQRGYFLARRAVFERKIGKYGIMKYPLTAIFRLWIIFQIILVYLKNPKDDRLAAMKK